MNARLIRRSTCQHVVHGASGVAFDYHHIIGCYKRSHFFWNSQDYSLFCISPKSRKDIFNIGYLLLLSVHLALRVYFIVTTVSEI